jgi:hypothetical protein
VRITTSCRDDAVCANGKKASSRTALSTPIRRMSATTPTTVTQGFWVVSLVPPVPYRKRFPMAPFGKYVFTACSFTIATGIVPWRSLAVKLRPATSRAPMVFKNPGLIPSNVTSLSSGRDVRPSAVMPVEFGVALNSIASIVPALSTPGIPRTRSRSLS